MANDAFAAPSSVDHGNDLEDATQIASLGQRLAGALVDLALSMLCYAPPMLILVAAGGPDANEDNPLVMIAVVFSFLALVVGLTAVQWTLIHQRGQSLGKIASGTRIVKMNGQPVTFVEGVILRNWVIALPTGVLNQCCMGWIITLVDTLMIFGEDHRCLHDIIANTKVVLAEPPGQTNAGQL